MKKFIEVHDFIGARKILNLDSIEEITEDENGSCAIFMRVMLSEGYQDVIVLKETYEQLRSMIANIQGGFTVPPEMAKVGELE